jgi:hypothetical protein
MPPSGFPLPQAEVVIIEDNDFVRDVLLYGLGLKGLRVAPLNSPVEIACQPEGGGYEHIKVVVTDLSFPVPFEQTRAWLRARNFSGTFVIYSGNPGSEEFTRDEKTVVIQKPTPIGPFADYVAALTR